MGYDLYMLNTDGDEGYFRANIWSMQATCPAGSARWRGRRPRSTVNWSCSDAGHGHVRSLDRLSGAPA
jgi:hypothetical protein